MSGTKPGDDQETPAQVVAKEEVQAQKAGPSWSTKTVPANSRRHQTNARAVGKVDPGLANVVSTRLSTSANCPARNSHGCFNTAFYSYVPYAIFCMMPLFALYLKVLYLGSGRRFGEHLLFALHTQRLCLPGA
jgi:hypothetical protein